jgi:hypothetical protein
MTTLQAIAAAVISSRAASIKLPFCIHPIANASSHWLIWGDCQTRPRLGHAPSIFTAVMRVMIWASSMLCLWPWMRFAPFSASAYRRLYFRCGWAIRIDMMWVYLVINCIFLCEIWQNSRASAQLPLCLEPSTLLLCHHSPSRSFRTTQQRGSSAVKTKM